MAYMKRATTLVLFLLLLATLGFFAVSVVKYQGDLTELNDDIRNKRVEITTLTREIEDLNATLADLNQDLTIQQEREEELSSQYLDVKGEKETLEEENARLTTSLTNLTLEYQNLEADYNETVEDLEDVTGDVEDICGYSATSNITECEDYR